MSINSLNSQNGLRDRFDLDPYISPALNMGTTPLVATPTAVTPITPTGAPWTQAQIDRMWHDGIRGNAEAAQAELDAWVAAQAALPPPAPPPPPPPPVTTGPPPPVVQPPPQPPTPTPVPPPGTPTSPPVTPTAPTAPLPGTREYYMQQVNQTFQPGFEYGAVPSSLLDDVISEILAEQQGDANAYLERGKARGIYNDVGYNAGIAAMDDYSTAGSADLNTLGGTVIDKYRTQADAVADNAYMAASGYAPGMSFSLSPYIDEFGAIKQRAASNVEGDLRNLLGGKNYFDFGMLTSDVGQAQGALNLRDTDVATALAERTRKNSIARGLGSQGAF